MCARRGFYLVKCDVNDNVLHASDCNDEGSSHNAQRCDSNVKFGKIMTQRLMEERAKSSPDEPMKQVYYSIKSEILRNREENKDVPSRSINDFPSFNTVAKKLYEIRNKDKPENPHNLDEMEYWLLEHSPKHLKRHDDTKTFGEAAYIICVLSLQA